MTPVLPTSSICYFSSLGNASITKKDCYRGNCGTLWKFRNQTVPQRCSTPLSISPLLFSPFRNDSVLLAKLRTHKVTASGTDVTVEEANPAVNHKESDDLVGSLSVPAEESEDSSIKSNAISISSRSKPPRVARKSDMPPIKNEDLVPGATFTGKVRSILQFGAFVDFGAFTDGLVHVSQLSDSFVKDVKDVVSIGQEVTVILVEANTETGRISLTMRNSDETNKGEPQKQVNSGSDNSRSPRKSNLQSNQRRNETRKSSKFVKGQELEGTVKNLTRSGAFISLPEGEEGFLPTSEEAAEGFGNMMGGTSLQAGQEVKVRVLRFNRGQVTLTMKDEDDGTGSDTLIRPSVVHTATNPFVLAFRQNKDISAFLDKHQKEMEQTSETVVLENNAVDKIGSPETIDNHKSQEGILPEASSMILTLEAGPSVLDDQTEVSPFTDKAENVEEPDLSQPVTNFSSETVISEEITQTLIPDVAVEDITLSQKLVEHNSPVKSEEVEPDQEINSTVASEQVEVASNAESMINGL